MHHLLIGNESALAEARAESARLRKDRDAARAAYVHAVGERDTAVQERQKMSENLPQLVMDYYSLKESHRDVERELEMSREENAMLRQKLAAAGGDAGLEAEGEKEREYLLQSPGASMSDVQEDAMEDDRDQVKMEVVTRETSPVVKQEAVKTPVSPSDFDVEMAVGT